MEINKIEFKKCLGCEKVRFVAENELCLNCCMQNRRNNGKK